MAISHEEFTRGFAKWFASWDTDKGSRITEAQLRAGIDKDLAFSRGGTPARPGRAEREGKTLNDDSRRSDGG